METKCYMCGTDDPYNLYAEVNGRKICWDCGINKLRQLCKIKIVSWNCKMLPLYNKEGFTDSKASYIDKKYNADIYVIQECTKYDIKKLNNFKKHITWYGDNIDSKYGIGIFSNRFKIELLDDHNPEFRYIVPYKIFDETIDFTLFAVWTKPKDRENKKIGYTEQIWNAINFSSYKKYLNDRIILIGDFNSNNFWEKEYKRDKVPSHKDIIGKLSEYGIGSAYHKYFNCENGNEKDPTELHGMNIDKRYHVDYCFISRHFEIKNVEVGDLVEWEKVKHSDHCPLFVEFNF